MRKHGNKVYLQVLLDEARCNLLQELAGNAKLSHYIRETLYSHIQRKMPAERYNEALDKDRQAYEAGQVNRIGSRILNALQKDTT